MCYYVVGRWRPIASNARQKRENGKNIMDRRAFLSASLMLPIALTAGCGSGSTNNIVGGENAVITGTNRSTLTFGPTVNTTSHLFFNGSRTVWTTSIVLTGSDFGAGAVALPIPVPGFSTLSRYAISFVDEPDVQSDLTVGGGGTQLIGTLYVPAELVTTSTLSVPRRVQVYDRLSRKYIPFTPVELATVGVQAILAG